MTPQEPAENQKGQNSVAAEPPGYAARGTYRWGNNPRRAELKGRAAVVLARGTKGSVLLLFPDTGERVVSSWRAAA